MWNMFGKIWVGSLMSLLAHVHLTYQVWPLGGSGQSCLIMAPTIGGFCRWNLVLKHNALSLRLFTCSLCSFTTRFYCFFFYKSATVPPFPPDCWDVTFTPVLYSSNVPFPSQLIVSLPTHTCMLYCSGRTNNMLFNCTIRHFLFQVLCHVLNANAFFK